MTSEAAGTLTIVDDGEPDVVFFEDAAAFRSWLEQHHETATELWMELRRAGNAERGMTWEDAVPEALCFGCRNGGDHVGRAGGPSETQLDLRVQAVDLQPDARMRDVDALQQIGIGRIGVESRVACHRREVFILLQERRQRCVVGAIGIGEAEYGRQAVPLEQEL